MEVGANRKALVQLGVAVAVLAIVVYFQFLRDPAAPTAPPPRPQARPAAASDPAVTQTSSRPSSSARSTGGRFRPRLGRSRAEDAPDPMTADTTLRTDLLIRVRGIEEPAVERDIFNFGRPPRPAAEGPTPAETAQAQARLQAAMTRPASRPNPVPKRKAPAQAAKPPNWKYYGFASLPGQDTRRAFLLDGEEILVAVEGALVQEQYRMGRIGQEALVLEDIRSGQEFTIRLETSR